MGTCFACFVLVPTILMMCMGTVVLININTCTHGTIYAYSWNKCNVTFGGYTQSIVCPYSYSNNIGKSDIVTVCYSKFKVDEMVSIDGKYLISWQVGIVMLVLGFVWCVTLFVVGQTVCKRHTGVAVTVNVNEKATDEGAQDQIMRVASVTYDAVTACVVGRESSKNNAVVLVVNPS